MNYCTWNDWGTPEYTLVVERGHNTKQFMMKVVVNNVEYFPEVTSRNKKHGKRMAASVALKGLGVIPADTPPPT